jgi:hypothetical protein
MPLSPQFFTGPQRHRYLFPATIQIGQSTYTSGQLYLATLIGLAMTGVIVAITNYLYRARDHLELLLRWTVRHRHCSGEHALFGSYVSELRAHFSSIGGNETHSLDM